MDVQSVSRWASCGQGAGWSVWSGWSGSRGEVGPAVSASWVPSSASHESFFLPCPD